MYELTEENVISVISSSKYGIDREQKREKRWQN